MRLQKFSRTMLGVATMTAAAGTAQAGVIDFDSLAGFTSALPNGRHLNGSAPFDGMFTLTSSGSNKGAAIYNSNGVNTRDPDLNVGFGNMLILQSNDDPTKFTGTDNFKKPNDSANGGTLIFDFVGGPLSLQSLDVIDVDQDGRMKITMWDVNDNRREITVHDDFTGDITQGDQGWATIRLDSTEWQQSPEHWWMFAWASDTGNFNSNQVRKLKIQLDGSGAIDNIVFNSTVIPLPPAAFLGGFGVLGVAALRRRRNAAR